jgi:hypothetical protein
LIAIKVNFNALVGTSLRAIENSSGHFTVQAGMSGISAVRVRAPENPILPTIYAHELDLSNEESITFKK